MNPEPDYKTIFYRLLFAAMFLSVLLLLCARSEAQTSPYSLMPVPRQCFVNLSGNPLAAGQVFTYSAGTTTPLATYSDNTGLYQNSNPVILDSAGCGAIWLSGNAYKIIVKDSLGSQIYSTDNVSDVGSLLYARSVLLSPTGSVEQDVLGPLGANYFVGLSNHTTSPNVRVALLAPVTTLDTVTNPPTVTTTNPALASQNYNIPDPGTAQAAFILSPGQTTNTLDCTVAGITCKRTAYAYLEGAACNNTTALMGWDTFPTNSPLPICITGSNVQKGVLALPSAATKVQENTGTGAAAGTCTTTYPAATVAGNLLEVEIAVDGGKTVTGVTDGTNAYTKAVNITNGNTDLEIWYFNGSSTSMPAATTLTVTLSANANCALDWKEYNGIKTAGILDVTATNTGTGTAVTSGTTAGTAQNTELVLAAVASPSNPSISGANGFVKHSTVAQSTNVSVSSEGLVQQATATQSGNFTLGSSQAWASAVVTFKANVVGSIVAQRQFRLPSTFLSTIPMNADIVWQAPLVPTGTVTVKLGAQVGCTAAGNTDDPTFNASVTATPTVSATSANILADTALNALTVTGCAAGNLLHYQIVRQRYDPSDTYEGYVYVNGAGLVFGTNQ
jgi:hypothetical protein